MMRVNSLSILLFILALVAGSVAAPCPVSNHPGNLHAGRIVVALHGGLVPINQAQDSQCYNYNLPYAMQSVPEVAISVHDFEAEKSKHIFYFIKTIRSDSLSSIPFVVRTQWAYTLWTQITFSFIAEDRNDLQSGYYQIDSGSLSNCDNGKDINVLLPFKNVFSSFPVINHLLFLHGFQITTKSTQNNLRSPFELQIIHSVANISGIAVTLSVTTVTQVNSIYISYIAFQTTGLQYASGSYVFDRSNGGILEHQTSQMIPRNYARLFGLSGFIINYNAQKLALSTLWDGFSFEFKFGGYEALVQYFSYNYIFFYGSECAECPGYSILHEEKCVNFCPINTYKTPENICLSCGEGRHWNGKECQISCPEGQFLNSQTHKCECPPSMNWNGDTCVACSNGKVWEISTKSCECPLPLRWNGFACARLPECSGGKIWDVYTYSCKCPDYQYESFGRCIDIPLCTGGQVLNSAYRCVCPQNYIWNGQSCSFTPCIGGQVWTGSSCVCSPRLNFNGTMCIECINGQIWSNAKLVCECNGGYKWNGQFCERSYECTGNRIWNSTYEQCVCAQQYYWSGYACLPVPVCQVGQYWNSVVERCVCYSGQHFNGVECVFCDKGQIWNQNNLTCSCPPGSIENLIQNSCTIQQQCTGGKVWVAASWSCECPSSTFWNGNFCIVNPCNSGRVWDAQLKACKCNGNLVWINEACVPPQIACNKGRVWNNEIYACQCPQGTFPRPSHCESTPVCVNGMVYNPLNNRCNCPYGLVEKNGRCVSPNCKNGQYWNGYECVLINCPPPSYFHLDRCVYGGVNQCNFGYVWNGVQCIYYPNQCPSGTNWSGSTCSSTSQCGNGNYLNVAGQCNSFSQLCPPQTNWSGEKCSAQGNACPSGTYLQGNKCLPYVPCKNGHLWDSTYLRCVCPAGKISNGNACLDCPSQKTWIPSEGCVCPEGSFDTGATCETLSEHKCGIIPNSIWQSSKCKCRPGFTKINFQCVCHGTQVGNLCDKCAYKPNSELNQLLNECHCKSGYTQIRGNCVPVGQNIGQDDPTKCSPGTFFDNNHKMCLACPSGCLSCSDCYTCRVCHPNFIYDSRTHNCVEMCGDGKRFVSECDDGNNNDGDGCSRDCRVESGYRCLGGSPDGPDSCISSIPSSITLEQTGQIRKSQSIILNVKMNYLPNSLLLSQDCNNNCRQILTGQIISGDVNAVSITSEFVPGTTYSFTVKVEFGRQYIGKFTISIGLSSKVSKYFGSIPVNALTIDVEPSYLAAISDKESLS